MDRDKAKWAQRIAHCQKPSDIAALHRAWQIPKHSTAARTQSYMLIPVVGHHKGVEVVHLVQTCPMQPHITGLPKNSGLCIMTDRDMSLPGWKFNLQAAPGTKGTPRHLPSIEVMRLLLRIRAFIAFSAPRLTAPDNALLPAFRTWGSNSIMATDVSCHHQRPNPQLERGGGRGHAAIEAH